MITDAQLTPALLAVHQENARRKRVEQAKRRPPRIHDIRTVNALTVKAMGAGYKPHNSLAGHWDISGDCQHPRVVELFGAQRENLYVYARKPHGRVRTLWMHVRCRACGPCLVKRRNQWAYRAQIEMAHAPRTWMATFTWSPAAHLRMRMAASLRLFRGAVDLELLPRAEQIAEISKEYRSELTKYFKRIRKMTGAQFRYLLVQEQHKSGQPHFHALIHERGPVPLKHAALQYQWTLGHTKFKLCEGVKAAWYVAKYLSKSMLNRVRASIGYGKETALSHSPAKLGRDDAVPSRGHPPAAAQAAAETGERNVNCVSDIELRRINDDVRSQRISGSPLPQCCDSARIRETADRLRESAPPELPPAGELLGACPTRRERAIKRDQVSPEQSLTNASAFKAKLAAALDPEKRSWLYWLGTITSHRPNPRRC